MTLCRIALMQLLLNCYDKKLVLLLSRILLLFSCRLFGAILLYLSGPEKMAGLLIISYKLTTCVLLIP